MPFTFNPFTGNLDWTAASHDALTLGSPANGLSLAGQQLSLALSASGVTGALSGTDWDAFAAKQAALSFPLSPTLGGTGANNSALSAGQVGYWSGTNTLTGSSGFVWDETSKTLTLTTAGSYTTILGNGDSGLKLKAADSAVDNGSNIYVLGGDSVSGFGGSAYVQPGNGGASAGSIYIRTLNVNTPGAINVEGGNALDGNNAGTYINISAGVSHGNGQGGIVSISAGDGGIDGDGGDIVVAMGKKGAGGTVNGRFILGLVGGYRTQFDVSNISGSDKIYMMPNVDGTLALGAGTLTSSTTNDVTTGSHTHAITPSLGLLSNGTAQYQVLTTGATPFSPVYSGFLLDGTTGGKTSFAVTNTKTLTLTATDDYNLTIPATGTAVLGTGASGRVGYWSGTNVLTSNANFLYDGTKLSITHDATGKDELIHLWGGNSDPLSGPSVGFYHHYGDGAFPAFKVGEIVSTWAYPDKADITFYVNDGTDLVNGSAMLAGLRLLGVGTGRVDAHFSNGTLYADGSVASQIKMIAKGSVSQSANLQEWQTNDGTPRAFVTPYGGITSNPLDTGAGGIAGITVTYNHISDDLGYALNFNVGSLNNGLTSGTSISAGFFGGVTVAALTANSFANVAASGFVRNDFQANSSYTAKANTSAALVIDAPQLAGAGTFVIGEADGIKIGNQGNSSTTTAYGINIASQSGAGTNYAIYTNAGDIRLMASGADKMGIWGATPIVQPTIAAGNSIGATLTDNTGGTGTADTINAINPATVDTSAAKLTDVQDALHQLAIKVNKIEPGRLRSGWMQEHKESKMDNLTISMRDGMTGNTDDIFAVGLSIRLPIRVEMPCGNIFELTSLEDLPHEDVPCPCGNRNHWFVKIEKPFVVINKS